MKTLRNFTLLLAMAAITLTSCKKEGCTNEQSENYDSEAKKDDGTCVPWRNKFLGTYSAVENCTSGNGSYTLTVSESSAGAVNVILNIDGITISGTVSGNSITMPNQTVIITGFSFTFSGSGQLSGNILTLSYSISDSGFANSCTATCTKQ